jgi:hypothetical protein
MAAPASLSEPGSVGEQHTQGGRAGVRFSMISRLKWWYSTQLESLNIAQIRNSQRMMKRVDFEVEEVRRNNTSVDLGLGV